MHSAMQSSPNKNDVGPVGGLVLLPSSGVQSRRAGVSNTYYCRLQSQSTQARLVRRDLLRGQIDSLCTSLMKDERMIRSSIL